MNNRKGRQERVKEIIMVRRDDDDDDDYIFPSHKIFNDVNSTGIFFFFLK